MSTPPVKYARYFDFTTFATQNPDKPLPGASVDVEFNRLKSTTDQTIDRLNLIQRDDGKLRDGAITENSIADGAVTTPKIADLAVTTPKLADGAVTGAKIAPNSLIGLNLAVGSITTRELADGGVQTVDLADGSVTTPKILDANVTTPKLADGAVTGPKLAPGAVQPGNIPDGSLPATKLVPGSVGTAQLTDGSVTTPKLANGSVTSAKIADGTIDPVDFSALSLALITTAGNPRGAWVTNTDYLPRDAVTMANGVYICLLAHHSGVFAADLAAGDWFQTGQVFDQSLNKADAVQFAKVLLGGITNGFPMLKPTGPVMAVRLADDSGDASITAKDATLSGKLIAAANSSIGGVLPPWDNAYRTLNVGATGAIFGNAAAASEGIYLTSNLYYSGGWKLATANPAAIITCSNGTYTFYNAPTGAAGSAAALTQRMALDVNGNLTVSGTVSPGQGGKLDSQQGRIVSVGLSSLSANGPNYDIIRIPPAGFTSMKVRATMHLQNIQPNYAWQYREDVFFACDSGGVDNSKGPQPVTSAKWSINTAVIDVSFSYDFIRSSNVQYLRVYPNCTGAQSAGALLLFYAELSLLGDGAKTAF